MTNTNEQTEKDKGISKMVHISSTASDHEFYTKPKEERNQLIDQALKVLDTYLTNYQPATVRTVDLFMSTAELRKMVIDFSGVPVEIADIFIRMEQLQFTYGTIGGGTEFAWLLKRTE